MRFRSLAATGASVITASLAFQDTSPFLALLPSTSSIDSALTRHYASSSKVNNLASDIAKTCPSSSYVVVSQPGFSANDHGASQPHFARHAKSIDTHSIFVPEVVGHLDADTIVQQLQTGCGGTLVRVNGSEGSVPALPATRQVIRLEFAAPPRTGVERQSALRRHDATFNALLTSLEGSSGKPTVLFITTPVAVATSSGHEESMGGHVKSHVGHSSHAQHPLQVDFDDEDVGDEAMHVAWKRDTDGHIPAHLRRRQENGTNSNGGLFERYNYLSPGIFMGGVALILLLSILLVAMNAVASVEVSHNSFNKEMVQAMTKAQKQQ